jgi:hypothetical protein
MTSNLSRKIKKNLFKSRLTRVIYYYSFFVKPYLLHLLNTVYKIGSGIIASRLKRVLKKLIDLDQTGFISGRYIGDNIRLIYDMLQFTEEKQMTSNLSRKI